MRPVRLLQGSRLTAYEAQRAGIPYRVLADSAAASLMAAGEVDLVTVGADRIAADGSVANKVGTYGLAVLARHHRVPFVVVAPVSTIDFGTADGKSIVIEERAPRRNHRASRAADRTSRQSGLQSSIRCYSSRSGHSDRHGAWRHPAGHRR